MTSQRRGRNSSSRHNTARSKSRGVVGRFVEQLEDRRLLTALFGGDVFNYQQAPGQLVRISATGNTMLEVAGGVIDDQNKLILTDLPGQYQGTGARSGNDVLGGIGGANGTREIGHENYVLPPGALNDGSDENVQALATSSTGQIYAINWCEIENQGAGGGGNARYVQIVQLDDNGNQTSVASPTQSTLRDDVAAQVTGVNGPVGDVAIDPTDGTMYVLTEDGNLYTVNRTTGAATLIGVISSGATQLTAVNLRAMAFSPAGQLYILTTDFDNDPNTDTSGRATGPNPGGGGAAPTTTHDLALIAIDKATATFTAADITQISVVDAQSGAQYEADNNGYFAMVFDTQNPGNILAVELPLQQQGGGGGGAAQGYQLSRINVATGVSTPIGNLGVNQQGGGGGGGQQGVVPHRVDGLTWALDANGQPILVGIDNGIYDQFGAHSALISVNVGQPDQSTLLSPLDTVVPAQGLASYTEPGDTKPLLWTVDGGNLIRGSVVTLPFDAQTGNSAAKSVRAAAFNPINGLLYFVIELDIQGAPINPQFTLYTINVNAANISATQNSLTRQFVFYFTPIGGGQTMSPAIEAIAFDRTGIASATMVGYAVTSQGNRLVNMNMLGGGGYTYSPPILMNGQAVSGITGLSFLGDDPAVQWGDDPTRPDTFIYASQNNGAASQMLRIRRVNGMVAQAVSPEGPPPTAIVWGLMTPAHGNPWSGDNIQDLTWDPTMINPYTFQMGALLGTDQTRDTLVVIDPRLRSPNISLFDIHFTQSDLDSSVIISRYIPTSDPNPADRGRVTPFEGSIGQLRVIGEQNPIDAPANSGYVLVGFKSNDVDCVASGDDLRPYLIEAGSPSILQGLISRPFGQINVGDGYIPVGVFAPMGGILQTITNPSALMIGQNLDDVQAASAAANGTIAVIDSDRCNQAGRATVGNTAKHLGDQLALIQPGAARATNVVDVLDVNGNALWGAVAIDWADPDGDGIQALYAVYNIQGVPTLGTIDANPASATYGQFTAIGAVGGGAITGVQAMAFSPTQYLYVVDDTGSLFIIDPSTGNLYAGPLVTGLPTIKSMDFNALGRLYAQDIQNAKLIDIDTWGGGTFGRVLSTPDGSLRASVGAITYNPATGQFMALDNGIGRESLETGNGPVANRGSEANSNESAMLLQIVGLSAAQAVPQDLGKFFLGGTLMGQVQVSGSIRQFYAGWLLTGATGGTGATVPVPSNFHAGGDIREVDVYTSIGTNDASPLARTGYRTGFELTAGGRVGQIKVGTDMLGSAYATNDPLRNLPADTFQNEIETGSGALYKTLNVNVTVGPTTGDRFMQGFLSDNVFFNDTFATAQFLGTINSTLPGQNAVRVRGELVGTNNIAGTVPDVADYYGVALLAGQSVVVQLLPLSPLFYGHIGVYDPDGRLIATDYSDIDLNQYQYQRFVFKADRPGVYRFAVGGVGDGTFNGGPNTYLPGPYEVDITASADGTTTGPGNVGLGGVVAGRNIYDGRASGSQFMVSSGDLGGISAGAFYASSTVPTQLLSEDQYLTMATTKADAEVGATIDVAYGSMRSIDAKSVGFWTPGPPAGPSLGVDVHAINGTVGLIRSTGTDPNDTLYVNDALALLGVPRVSDHDIAGVARQVAAGGDVQLVSSNTQFTGAILTNTRIGVIRAASIPFGNADNFFVANADQQGYDGTIDLVYSQGDIGSFQTGGPAIITGPGGNLRYMYAGGVVWRDFYFGFGNNPEDTLFQPGEPAAFTDDSGAYVTISTAAPPRTDPGATPPSLHVTTYGVRGSGGVAIASIRADGYATNSINISSSSFSPLSGVEIGRIQLTGTGQAPVVGAGGRLTLPTIPAGQIPLFLQIGGTANVDVFDVTGGDIYSLINATGGEVVNVTATTIGRLESGYVGVAKHYTDTVVNGLAIRANNYPFVQQRSSINSGNIAMVIAKHAIGNVNSTGTIGQVIADSDRIHDWWEYDGIVAPIFAGGAIQDVSIGQGITASGSGMLAFSGLFANGPIGTVRGTGDIRGNIVSNTSIGRITLNGGGSIINANIMVPTDLIMSREFLTTPNFALTYNGTPFTRPTYQIAGITIQGARPTRFGPALNGGIIGANIMAGHIGPVNVQNGFGVIDSYFGTMGDGTFAGITTDGYGIRDVTIDGGAVVTNLIAVGNGTNIPVSSYSYQLRQSEFAWMEFDYRRGLNDWSAHFEPNRTTDLDMYMGTTAANPSMPFDAITSGGVIAGLDARVSRTINQVKAWSVRPSDRTTTRAFVPDPVTGAMAQVDTPLYAPSNFHAANKLTYFDIAHDAIDIQVTTGAIKRMTIGGDMIGPSITVSGIFSTLQIQGHYIPTVLQQDYELDCIQAIGGNGELTSLYVGGGVNLPIMAQRKIGKWTVMGKNSPFGRFGPRGKIMVKGKQMAP